jgi:hypothetical protein
MGGAFSMHGRDDQFIQIILIGRPEVTRPLGRRKLIWDDNIKMYLK